MASDSPNYIPSFPPKGILQVTTPKTRVLVDLDHFPFFLMRVYGLLDVDGMRLCYMLRDPYCAWAAKHNTKLWALWDWSTIRPKDISRKLAELTTEADRFDGYLGVTMVVNNRLLRGAITAVLWITGERVPVDYAKDFAHAIRNAHQGYRANGLKPPPLDEGYQLADWDDARPTINLQTSDLWWTLESRGEQFVPEV